MRVGMIGTSWWADAMFLPALAAHPGAELVAICGRNEARARDKAYEWHIPQVYTDYRKLIDSGEVDALVVATPNDSHYPITMHALDAGLHVLCEKPLAMDYAQAREMAEKAAEKHAITMVPFTYRFMPVSRYIKELIDSGYLGQPYHCNLRYYAGYARKRDYMWRFDAGVAGSGVLGDLGSHFTYLAHWFFGDVVAVTARLASLGERADLTPAGEPYTKADDVALITLEFANGALGVVHASSMAYEDTPSGQFQTMELHGSEGTLHGEIDWDTVHRVSGARAAEGPVRELPIPDHIWQSARRETFMESYNAIFREEDHMTREFISAILKGEQVDPDLAAGARIQRILDAALLSHQQGRRVLIEEITG